MDPKAERTGRAGLDFIRRAGARFSLGLLVAGLALALAACEQAASPTTAPTAAPSLLTTTPAAAFTTPTSIAAARPPSLLTPTTAAASSSATPLSQQQLDQVALSVSDLPAGFAITASGPGGPDLGPDVLTSYQEEFQQRDVTSSQSLQQTIVIINLLGQYKDAASALAGIRAINVQNLNQILGGVNMTATPATVPAIGEDSEGYHFTGTTNGVAIGGYLIAFHHGPVAALLLTAGVQGSESLDQTVSLAQKQAQKLATLG